MPEPIGDKIFTIILFVLCATFIIGWFLLLIELLIERFFFKQATRIKLPLKQIHGTLWNVQKYAGYIALALLAIRLVAGWLGWTSPVSSISDSPD